MENRKNINNIVCRTGPYLKDNFGLFKKIPDISYSWDFDIFKKTRPFHKAIGPRIKWLSRLNRSKFQQAPENIDRPIFTHTKWFWLAKVKSERKGKYAGVAARV